MAMSVDEAREEYRNALDVERFAVRQRREATAELLRAMGVPLRFTTLRSTTEPTYSWLTSVDDLRTVIHFPPAQRRRLRELRALKLNTLRT